MVSDRLDPQPAAGGRRSALARTTEPVPQAVGATRGAGACARAVQSAASRAACCFEAVEIHPDDQRLLVQGINTLGNADHWYLIYQMPRRQST
jgi:hypothetical protein